MRVLVTGASGQLARSLAELGDANISVKAIGRPKLDICNLKTVSSAIEVHKPDVVVNAAAYTSVDAAETEQKSAFAINRDGARGVATVAADAGLPIIHISTDYVFSGDKNDPYAEDDKTGPAGVYGQSKLAGEQAVAVANRQHVILRTAWVYSAFGNNFVKTMLCLASERNEVAVVADQFGNPTAASDLAAGVIRVAEKLTFERSFTAHGIYHLCGTGQTNWADFARHIFSVSTKCGGPYADVRDITTSDYPTAAKRPLNSCLSTDRYRSRFNWRLPDWRHSCAAVVDRIVGMQ